MRFFIIRVLFLFIFLIPKPSYAKVVDINLDIKYGIDLFPSKSICFAGGGCGPVGYSEEISGNVGINFKIISGLFLGLNYDYTVFTTEDEEYKARLHRIIPGIGWNFPVIVKFINFFIEFGVGVWNKLSENSSNVSYDNIKISYKFGGGCNFHVLKWFSLQIKQGTDTYDYTHNDGGRTSFWNLELGMMFSF